MAPKTSPLYWVAVELSWPTFGKLLMLLLFTQSILTASQDSFNPSYWHRISQTGLLKNQIMLCSDACDRYKNEWMGISVCISDVKGA